MSMEFDAVSKYLLESGPQDWLALCGRPTSARISSIESDLSTVTANADKLYRVEEDPPWLVNFEPFSSRDKKAPQRICLYSILASAKLDLPVFTVVILLSRRADCSEWSGTFQSRIPGEPLPYLSFQYAVLRVWEIPAEVFLKGGIATLALAPISRIGKNEVPRVLREVLTRVDTEVQHEERRNYRAAICSLMGLKYQADFVLKLFQDTREMRESSVVQLWLKEGREEGLREGEVKGELDALLTVLQSRFGEIDFDVVQQLSEISDIGQLNTLIRFAATDKSLEVFLNRITA